MTKVIYEPMSALRIQYMGGDVDVVNAARVSFKKEVQVFSDKDEKLIAYLGKHNHWSPFAHVMVKLRVKMPIFVKNQMWKSHIGANVAEAWNEVSRRYVDDVPTFWRPNEWRGRPVNAKQGSSDTFVEDIAVQENAAILGEGYEDTTQKVAVYAHHTTQVALDCYMDMIAGGVAPEMARTVLPLSMHTEWIWTGSLLFWSRIVKQRIDNHAQQESQEVAAMIRDAVAPIAPVSWQALMSTKEQ